MKFGLDFHSKSAVAVVTRRGESGVREETREVDVWSEERFNNN
jgi:hypothetical protein